MIVVTMNALPGYRVDEVILAVRFDSDEVGTGYQELVAYGTAVKVPKL